VGRWCRTRPRRGGAEAQRQEGTDHQRRHTSVTNVRKSTTIDVIRWLVASYDLTAPDGVAVMRSMADAERALRLPAKSSDLGG